MDADSILNLGRQALWLCLLVSAPPLLVTLLIGLVISIFQAATQINEPSLSFVPKLIGLGVTFIIAGSWMLTVLVDFLRRVLLELPLWLS